jgi:hypothetical protein
MPLPTRDQVADWLGIPSLPEDDRLTACTEAAIVWVMKRRSLTTPEALWLERDTELGTVMYAGLLYGSRAQPQGFPGFDQLGVYTDDVGMAIHRVYQLVGLDPVIA